MSEDGHFIVRVRPGDSAHNERRHFHTGVSIELSGQLHPLIGDGTEARFRGSRHNRNEIGGRYRIRVVETGK